MHITSRSNDFLKHVRAVRDGRNRQAIFLEGVRLCEEALRSALAIEAVSIPQTRRATNANRFC